MKLSREFNNKEQAHARERALQTMGYRAWLNCKADGNWQLYWQEQDVPAGARPALVL